MNSEKMSLKEFFKKSIDEHKYIYSLNSPLDPVDHDQIFQMLMRDFNQTVEFLSNANADEVECIMYALDDYVCELAKDKAELILSILKKKQKEFPELEKSQYIDYSLELQIAQNIIDGKED